MQSLVSKLLFFKEQKVEIILYILAKCIRIVLDVIYLAMMVRALLPLFADVESSPFYMLTVAITEPIVAPIRIIISKLGIAQSTPIDMGFMATYLLLFVLNLFLPAI